jgi:hypothetical protein
MVLSMLFGLVISTTLFISILVFLKRKIIKNKRFRVCGYISLGLLGWLIIGYGGLFLMYQPGVLRDCLDRHICLTHLERLHKAMVQYCNDNNGKLPVSEKWCDLLKRTDPKLTANYFKCHVENTKLECGYSFNENLNEAVLSEVPEDTILLFEGGGNWNSTGGPDMIKLRHNSGKGTKMGCILLKRGPILIYSDTMDEYLKIEKHWNPSHQSKF